METLNDKSGKVCGFFYNNVILLPDQQIAGVVLAHCVFGKNGKAKGKYFKQCLFDEGGKIVAIDGPYEKDEITEMQAAIIRREAWEILARTASETFPWVTASNTWSKYSLQDLLLK